MEVTDLKDENCIDREGRKFIEKCLDERHSFVYIAKKLEVHPTTILREVLRNRIFREGRIGVRQRRNIASTSRYAPLPAYATPNAKAPAGHARA